MNNVKIKEGQDVYLVPINNKLRTTKEIQKYRVEKVGRKYFYVYNPDKDFPTSLKFDIETLDQITEYRPDWRIYFSMKMIEVDKEILELSDEIRTFLGTYGCCKLSLDQLRKIKNIIGGQ